jgi:hypothetical protein
MSSSDERLQHSHVSTLVRAIRGPPANAATDLPARGEGSRVRKGRRRSVCMERARGDACCLHNGDKGGGVDDRQVAHGGR